MRHYKMPALALIALERPFLFLVIWAAVSKDTRSDVPARTAADFVEWGPAPDPEAQFDLVLSQELSLQKLVAENPRILGR